VCAFLAAAVGSSPALAAAAAPYSGAPFLLPTPLGSLPAPEADELDPTIVVARLLPQTARLQRPAHACDAGDHADKGRCLEVSGRGCMWTRLQTHDPRDGISSRSYCLPCELDGQEIPCWNVGASVGDMRVTDCAMSCQHQKRIWQPQYACSDGAGTFASKVQCFDKGQRSGSKCMFIEYKDSRGDSRGQCGPCELTGSGSWGCPAAGSQGPEEGSTVLSCQSMCNDPCAGKPSCMQGMLGLPPSPGVARASAPADEMLSAPSGFMPPAAAGATEQGTVAPHLLDPTLPVPKVYFPVVIYRTPGDYAATTVPPPPLWPPPWWPTPPPPVLVQGRRPLLSQRGQGLRGGRRGNHA